MKNNQVKKEFSQRVAVIGCGNMGAALARGFSAELGLKSSNLLVFDPDLEKTKVLEKDLAAQVVKSEAEAASKADVIILAVKPGRVSTVGTALSTNVSSSVLVVSVAGGIPLQKIRAAVGDKPRLARVMPNIACTIAKGMSAIFTENKSDEDVVHSLFSSVGRTCIVKSEHEIDIATALGASSPAFIFLLIESLADGGVRLGLTRDIAQEMAAQAVFGAAAMVLESGYHPAELKDMVASPNGTTIAGLQILEQNAVRGVFISAVEAAAKRAVELANNKNL